MSTWTAFTTVFIEEVRRGTSRTWYRVLTLAIPVLLVVGMVAAPAIREVVVSEEEEGAPSREGLLDLSGLLDSADIEAAGLRPLSTRDLGIAALVDEEIAVLFVVAEDYMETAQVEWLHTRSGITESFASESATEQVVDALRRALISDSLDPTFTERFLDPTTFESIRVQPDGSLDEEADEAQLLSASYIFALLLIMSILTGSNFLLESVADEKQNRMIEIMLTSVSPIVVMGGKVVAMGTISVFQVLVWATSVVTLGPRLLDNFPEIGRLEVEPVLILWSVLLFLAGYFVVAVVMGAIGAATSSFRESSQISALITVPTIIPLVLFQVIAGDPFGPIARVLSFIPFTGPLTMMLRISAADISSLEIAGSLLVTVAGGLVLLWISARIFRAGILMYGQRMTLRTMFTALRQAS